jgi:hypothetical protein
VKISFPSLQILLIYISLVITPSNWYRKKITCTFPATGMKIRMDWISLFSFVASASNMT